MKKLKNGNQGFTMIELIIATAVLSVIMAPLMRAFVVASNTSRLTNIYGETSTAIKNVTELVTGASMSSIDDLDDIEAKLNLFPAYDTSVLKVSKFEYDEVGNWGTYDTWVSSKTGLKNSSSAFLENSKVFTLENANMGNGAGIMEVIVTPISSSAAEGALDYHEWYKDVNDVDFSSFTKMDITMLQPGIIETIDDVTNVVEYEVDELNHADYKATTYLTAAVGGSVSAYEKEMRITVKPSVNDPTLLNYKVEYFYNAHSKSISYTIFEGDAGYGDDGVCNIQIGYYPFYAPTRSTTPTVKNTITVNNEKNLPVKLFLMKQNMSGYELATFPQLIGAQHEYYYSCDLKLNVASGVTVDDSVTKIFTNMEENVIDPKYGDGDGNGVANIGTFNYFYGDDDDLSLKERLVADDSGGRAFNVHVYAYQKKSTGTGYDLIDQLTTVKLI